MENIRIRVLTENDLDAVVGIGKKKLGRERRGVWENVHARRFVDFSITFTCASQSPSKPYSVLRDARA